MQALLFGYLFSFARRTITQALVVLGLTKSAWSAFYRFFSIPRIDYEALSGRFLEDFDEPRGESTAYSPKLMELDFSHLRAKGIDTLITPTPQKR
jgi:hypothetical protein